MPPLYRAFWGVTLSAALHVAAVHWGGDLWHQEPPPPAPPEVTIRLALFEPPPEAPPAPPAVPKKKVLPPPRPKRQKPRAPEPVARVMPQPRAPDPEPARAPPPPLQPAPPPPPNPLINRRVEPAPPPPPPNPPREQLAFPKQQPDHSALVSRVRDGIDSAKHYPRLARQAGWEGRALLKFKLLHSGEVAELIVLESSGHSILDDAARRAVERAAPFPEEGRKIAGDAIEVILPVVFQLH